MRIKGRLVKVKGSVELSITLGDEDRKRTLKQSFMVAKINAPYNAIFGRSFLNELCAILSLRYLIMKFKIDKGIASVRGDQVEARR